VRPAGVLKHQVTNANIWLWVFGGWIVSLLWSLARREQVRCAHCETLFMRTSPGAMVARIILLIILLLVILGIWALLRD